MNGTTIVYSTSNCAQCKSTYRMLDKVAIPYEVVDISADPQALELVTALGYAKAPVVVATDGQSWAGFRPDKINALAATLKAAVREPALDAT